MLGSRYQVKWSYFIVYKLGKVVITSIKNKKMINDIIINPTLLEIEILGMKIEYLECTRWTRFNKNSHILLRMLNAYHINKVTKILMSVLKQVNDFWSICIWK